VAAIDAGTSGSAWSQTLRTRRGSEYLVTVTQNRISIVLMRDVNGAASPSVTLVKAGVWLRTLTDVSFVTLTAPYDRLLILTNNHPPVQLSFLERILEFTCTNAGTQQITAPVLSTDSPLWNDTTINGSFLIDSNNVIRVLSSKSPGFTMTVPGLGLAINQLTTQTLVNISWQWWAEALLWQGKDIAQSTTRYNVTAIDQNVKIPADLLTDMDQRFKESAYRRIFYAPSTNFLIGFALPTNTPTTPDTFGHGSGQRYTGTTTLDHTPFFATFGGTQAANTQTTAAFWRSRELRFNAGLGISASNLEVFFGGELRTFRTTYVSTNQMGDYSLEADSFGAEQTRGASITNTSTIATSVTLATDGNIPTYAKEFYLSNTETKWFNTSARKVMYTKLPAGGGTLDGTYVPAFGLGNFCDYSRGVFTTFGAIFRDRLVLKTATSSVDQFVFSATSDTLSPGEYYSFFQITDALKDSIDDPFTLNVTSKSRERPTALLSWQQALFVFTSSSTYSINGGELFGPESYTTSLVSSYGAFNQRCVVATNLTVLFLNRFGLFDLLNKNNTTDYGAFERSESVRPFFVQSPIPSTLDNLPFLTLNDSNNKVYIGLPDSLDTTVCTRILSLNLSWDSWSTLSSASPFSVASACQIGNSMVFTVRNPFTTSISILQMDARHNLDYAQDRGGLTAITTPVAGYAVPASIAPVTPQGLVLTPYPSPPVLKEYATLSKLGTNYYQSSGSFAGLLPRNYMHDISECSPVIGTQAELEPSPYCFILPNDPFPIYPRLSSSAGSLQFVATGSASGIAPGNPLVLGTIYPSIFASPTFNASSLGRLKRLKKLHLLFDNRSVNRSRYYDYPNRQLNSAVVLTVYNYEEQEQQVDCQLVGDYLRFDALRLGVTPSSQSREQLSIPLNGYGCDYQFYLCSTGADAFKLSTYEFDVAPQRTKTYVR
jgi:hypothetical protein